MTYVFPSSSNDDEVIVTLKMSKQYYETGLAAMKRLDFKSFDEYCSHAVMQDIYAEVEGGDYARSLIFQWLILTSLKLKVFTYPCHKTLI